MGAIWVVLSVLFEFGFGHYVEGDSWADLSQNYDATEGNIWLLVLLDLSDIRDLVVDDGQPFAHATTAREQADREVGLRLRHRRSAR